MNVKLSCLCCLRCPPDKELTTPYPYLGKTEIYADMLKECFNINLVPSGSGSCGICWACLGRLRDASDFKLQVQRCQAEMQALLVDGGDPPMKLETADDVITISDDQKIAGTDGAEPSQSHRNCDKLTMACSVRIERLRDDYLQKFSRRTTRRKRPRRVKRSKPTALEVWAARAHRRVLDDNPHLTGAELYKILGPSWNAMSEDEKQPYKELAKRGLENQSIAENQSPAENQPPAENQSSAEHQSPAENQQTILPDTHEQPMNVFTAWAQEERSKTMEDCPDLPHAAILRIHGPQWKAMSEDEKQSYLERARAQQDGGDKPHVKRPMNAFMVWAKQERCRIKQHCPAMLNSEISKILGARWKGMSEAEKQPYYEEQTRLATLHKLEHVGYKYQPRRKYMINGQTMGITELSKLLRERSLLGEPIPPSEVNYSSQKAKPNNSYHHSSGRPVSPTPETQSSPLNSSISSISASTAITDERGQTHDVPEGYSPFPSVAVPSNPLPTPEPPCFSNLNNELPEGYSPFLHVTAPSNLLPTHKAHPSTGIITHELPTRYPFPTPKPPSLSTATVTYEPTEGYMPFLSMRNPSNFLPNPNPFRLSTATETLDVPVEYDPCTSMVVFTNSLPNSTPYFSTAMTHEGYTPSPSVVPSHPTPEPFLSATNRISTDSESNHPRGPPPIDKGKHIKRPMNAFMIWAQGERHRITQERPHLHNSEISKMLGARWKTMTEEQKQPYVEEQARVAMMHSVTNVGYKYQPRPKRKFTANGKRMTIAEYKNWLSNRATGVDPGFTPTPSYPGPGNCPTEPEIWITTNERGPLQPSCPLTEPRSQYPVASGVMESNEHRPVPSDPYNSSLHSRNWLPTSNPIDGQVGSNRGFNSSPLESKNWIPTASNTTDGCGKLGSNRGFNSSPHESNNWILTTINTTDGPGQVGSDRGFNSSPLESKNWIPTTINTTDGLGPVGFYRDFNSSPLESKYCIPTTSNTTEGRGQPNSESQSWVPIIINIKEENESVATDSH